ncbi:amidohydrolase family protein [Paenibacillus agricola]|uniref:Amidohydrolase n=1 Tax=Paenibacillus agricola TaxID=2716264 RepID=A0ABX0J5X6_9BACL|nr:amidohydrolase family protein [Paenibacillus agricola]NHN30796.1 amidohydrolase [Paenibacillus agricola]
MAQKSIIVDADVHNGMKSLKELLPFLPRVWHDQWLEMGIGAARVYYSAVGGAMKDAVPEHGGGPGSDPEFMLKHLLAPYKIDYAILNSGVEISLYPDPDYANAVASAWNDWMNELWLKASPKFRGSIVVNSADPLAAAKEIDRMAANPNMVQVIMSSASRTLLGQRCFHPIYEAAERNGLPVAVHPGGEGRGISPAPTTSGYPTRYMEWHNILPANYMAHVNSLVCEGVFEKFPQLKFVAIEGGISWMPHLMWRMDKNFKALRSTVPWLKRRPSEYIREHIYLTSQPIEEPDDPKHLVQIFEMIGADKRVMFSTDYPHWDFDNPMMAMPPMPREMKRRVMGENAQELYKLPQLAEEPDDGQEVREP